MELSAIGHWWVANKQEGYPGTAGGAQSSTGYLVSASEESYRRGRWLLRGRRWTIRNLPAITHILTTKPIDLFGDQRWDNYLEDKRIQGCQDSCQDKRERNGNMDGGLWMEFLPVFRLRDKTRNTAIPFLWVSKTPGAASTGSCQQQLAGGEPTPPLKPPSLKSSTTIATKTTITKSCSKWWKGCQISFQSHLHFSSGNWPIYLGGSWNGRSNYWLHGVPRPFARTPTHAWSCRPTRRNINAPLEPHKCHLIYWSPTKLTKHTSKSRTARTTRSHVCNLIFINSGPRPNKYLVDLVADAWEKFVTLSLGL